MATKMSAKRKQEIMSEINAKQKRSRYDPYSEWGSIQENKGSAQYRSIVEAEAEALSGKLREQYEAEKKAGGARTESFKE